MEQRIMESLKMKHLSRRQWRMAVPVENGTSFKKGQIFSDQWKMKQNNGNWNKTNFKKEFRQTHFDTTNK